MQLLHNRMHTRVTLAPPTPEQAGVFLSRRVGLEEPLPPRMAADVAATAAGLGHFSFLRRVADHLEEEGAAPGITADDMRARLDAATRAARAEVAGK